MVSFEYDVLASSLSLSTSRRQTSFTNNKVWHKFLTSKFQHININNNFI